MFPNQPEWHIYFNCYAEDSKTLQNSKTASLKGSVLRAIEKSEKTRQTWLQQHFFFTWILSPIHVNWTAFPLWRDRPKTFIKLVLKLQQLQGQISKVIKPPPWIPPYLLFQGEWDSEGFSDKLSTVIPLNSQGQTKINGKPCKILAGQNLHSLLLILLTGVW